MKSRCAVVVLLLSWAPAAFAGEDPAASQPSPASTPAACGAPGHPGIALRAVGIDDALRTKIAEQLKVALAARSFDLCASGDAAGAVAELDISQGSASGVSLSLSVRDQVTDKRVAREIDLRGIPEDGRALVIADAADELLRASWAELLVADAPKPKRDVPPEITRALPTLEAASPAPAPRDEPPIVEVGVDAAVEHYASGHTQLGPDLSVGVFPLARLGAVARVGIRSAAHADSAAGSVDPSGVAGAFAILLAALPREGRIGLDGGAELFVTRVHYEATALPGSHAQSDSGTAVHASAVARGWALLARPLRATVSLSLGAPIHTVRAVTSESTIASISGVLLGATLGLGGAW
ncbi:MAG: hypothetical protein JWO86_4760 [Myxococcaceae bacterium]|nr:hypothetical protein [Myxococcaceae bacterium]